MKLHYCPETDSLYVEFRTGPGVETREVSNGLNVDLDADSGVVGFDIDRASERLDLSTLETEGLPLGEAAGTQRANRDEVLALLRTHKTELARRFRIVDLALFGSMARGAATGDSDVDILVRFDGPATSDRYFGAQFYIEDLLGRPVDLVTDKALRAEFRPYVERDAIYV